MNKFIQPAQQKCHPILVEHFGTALAVEGLAVKNTTQIASLDGLISVPKIIK